MFSFYKTNYTGLYTTIANFSRDKMFYDTIKLEDKLETRIYLIFIHFSLIFNILKKKNIDKKITQDIFDNLFQNIEYHFRELGMGDVSVNKKMKDLSRIFYDILLKIQNLNGRNKSEINISIVNKYLVINSKLLINNDFLSKYFEDFYNFCFNLDTKDIIRGKINYKYKHGRTQT